MNNHIPSPEEEPPGYKDPAPITFWIMLLLAVLCLTAGCKSIPSQAPHASTAAVGVNLDELGRSLGNARSNVDGVRSDLSEVDAKAVRIKEAIRNW